MASGLNSLYGYELVIVYMIAKTNDNNINTEEYGMKKVTGTKSYLINKSWFSYSLIDSLNPITIINRLNLIEFNKICYVPTKDGSVSTYFLLVGPLNHVIIH